MSKSACISKDKRGIKDFLGYNVFVIAAFLLPMLMVTACFIINEIEPFGRNIVMVSDAWHQYYPFLREFQMILKEGKLPLYSWNTGGGANFTGVVANYLASPINLFTVFLPDGHVWLESFLALTTALRIGLGGGFMAIFLRKAFHRNDLSLVFFSIMYALCGFVMGYYWNVMWLDSVSLLPFVATGVLGVLRDKKYSLYVISLALCIICNFYIGYVVCIFVLLFCVAYTVINFEGMAKSLKNAGKMAGLTLMSFMLTAFITIPAFLALSHSNSFSDVSGFPLAYSINSAYGYAEDSLKNTLLAIVRTLTNLLSFTRPISMDKGEPNIFCSTLAVVLGVFYITSKKIKPREKAVSLSFILFIVLSFVINQLNFIWHGFNIPAMVYYRFSFLFSFVLIAMAYRAFCLIDKFGRKEFLAASALLSVYLIAAFFVQRIISVIITVAVIALIMLLVFLYRRGKLSYKLLSALLCTVVVCDMGASTFYSSRFVGYYTGKDYPNQAESVKSLVLASEELSEDNELYRTEFVRPYSYNDGALYSIFGISTFNSMCREDYSDFFAELGLQASKKNNMYIYVESTPVTNLFLNIKYLIARADSTVDEEDEPIHISETVADTLGMKLLAESDGSRLYENTEYLPVGFMTDESLLEYELSDKSRLPQDTQNEFFSLATGIDKDVLVSVPESRVSGADLSQMTHYENLGTYYTYKQTEKEESFLTVEYEAPKTGRYYGLFRNSSKEKFPVTCGDRTVWDLDDNAHIVALGTCNKGDKISIDLPVVKTNNGRLGYYLFYLDENVFEEGYKKLSQSTMTLKEKTVNGLKGTIDVKKDGLFYTSVLYDEGWHAFVDGKEVEITPVAKTFCAFELSAGVHEIEFKFIPQGMITGAVVSCLGLVAFGVFITTLSIRKKKRT